MSEFMEPPPPELCLGCGDDLEHGWPSGTSDRHICPLRHMRYRPGLPPPP